MAVRRAIYALSIQDRWLFALRPLVEKPLGFLSHGGAEQQPCSRWCWGMSGQETRSCPNLGWNCHQFHDWNGNFWTIPHHPQKDLHGSPVAHHMAIHHSGISYNALLSCCESLGLAPWFRGCCGLGCPPLARFKPIEADSSCFLSHPMLGVRSGAQGRERSGVKRWVVWMAALGPEQTQTWWVSTAASAPAARWNSNHLQGRVKFKNSPNRSSAFCFFWDNLWIYMGIHFIDFSDNLFNLWIFSNLML